MKLSFVMIGILFCNVYAHLEIELIALQKSLTSLLEPYPQEFVNWLNKHPSYIIERDNQKDIYQLRVLQQSPNTCSIHAPRNSYYILNMLLSPSPLVYENLYNQMLNQSLYGSIQNKTSWCSTSFSIPFKDVKQLLSRETDLISQNIPELVEFNNWPQYYPTYEKEFGSTYRNKTFPYIEAIEKIKLTPEEKYDIELLQGNLDFYEKAIDFAQKTNGLLLVEPSIYTIMQHATTLVAAKKNGSLYLFFADPLNNTFLTAWSGNYKNQILSIYRFLSNTDYLKRSMIRYIFARSYNSFILYSTLPESDFDYYSAEQSATDFIENITELHLQHHPLVQKSYKQAFINFIIENDKKKPISSKEDLIKKINNL